MVTDLFDTECEKRQEEGLQRIDDLLKNLQNSRRKLRKNFLIQNPECKPQISKNKEPPSSLLTEDWHLN